MIIDSNVKKCYGDKFLKSKIIDIESDEKIKTLDTVNLIYEKFLKLELDRSSIVVGVGGGIVCDTAGNYSKTKRINLVESLLRFSSPN